MAKKSASTAVASATSELGVRRGRLVTACCEAPADWGGLDFCLGCARWLPELVVRTLARPAPSTVDLAAE